MKFEISVFISLFSITTIVFSRPEDFVEINEYDENGTLINQFYVPLSQLEDFDGYTEYSGMYSLQSVIETFTYRNKMNTKYLNCALRKKARTINVLWRIFV